MPNASALQYENSAPISTGTSLPSPPFPRFQSVFDAEPQRRWEVEVVRQLVRLAGFPDNWDSYGAVRLKKDAGLFALEILQKIMRPRTPIPQIVPTSNGGVQLEWHEKGIDLEINILAPYECELWYRDHQTQTPPQSLEFSNDFSALRDPIGQLTIR
jgi:hypothetical protein